MHLLLIHQAFVAPHEPGGTRHYELARQVVQQGHKVTIVASDVSYLSGKRSTGDSGLVSQQKLDGVDIRRAYTYPSLHRSFVWRVVSFMSFMVTSVLAALKPGSIDVVMGTSPPIFQTVSAWAVAKIRRRPLLLEIRDLWPEFAIHMGVLRSPILIELARWLEKFLYACASRILVNSPAYRDYLIDKGIGHNKVSLIPNGVDTGMFKEGANGKRFRSKWGLNGNFVVTYAGALGMANDIPTILRAAARLETSSNIRFLIVGDGKERPNLEAFASKLHLKNVVFSPSHPKVDMPEILAASDACIATLLDIPVFKTTYPNKVFDYMAAGRPTILGIDGVIRQVIEAAGGGIFIPPGDDKALANAITSLEKDRKKARAMGIAARNYVAKHFDRKQHSEQFVRLIGSLAE